MKGIPLTHQIYDYILAHTPPPNAVLPTLAHETRTLPGAGMQIAPEQGALMHLLVKLLGARRIVEVGCFTGYSAISMASALPADGRLITLDVDPNATSVAQRYFAAAGVDNRVELRLGPALTSLQGMMTEFGPGSFDMMFIDADKANSLKYYECGIELLRSGGVIVCDNALWDGTVADPENQEQSTNILRRFNEHIAKDDRVDRVMINIADGLYICRKR